MPYLSDANVSAAIGEGTMFLIGQYKRNELSTERKSHNYVVMISGRLIVERRINSADKTKRARIDY